MRVAPSVLTVAAAAVVVVVFEVVAGCLVVVRRERLWAIVAVDRKIITQMPARILIG
jgi:hypothetical protein